MDNSKLQDFVTITVLYNRITFGDVRRLQRDYLPHGLASREQVELLLQLDGMIDRADRAWADWLAAAVFDFAVFSERSVDAVESGTCDWLLDHLAALDISTKVTRRLERDLHQALEPIAPIEYVDEAAEPAEAIAEQALPLEQPMQFPERLPAPSMVRHTPSVSELGLAA
jgi:hypothetical protein